MGALLLALLPLAAYAAPDVPDSLRVSSTPRARPNGARCAIGWRSIGHRTPARHGPRTWSDSARWC